MEWKAVLSGPLWMLFFVHFVSSQTPASVLAQRINDCITQCDVQYDSLNRAALSSSSITGFIRSMSCDLTAAADNTCRQVDVVYSCYQACAADATNYSLFYSPTPNHAAVNRLKQVFCYTDNMKCRFMDSYYCEAIYNFRTCGQNLTRYIDCVSKVQLARGCSLGTNCFRSERVVQSKIFDSVAYCAMVNVSELVSQNSLVPAYAALQYCETAIRSGCMASFAGNVGDFSKYIDSNITCGEYSSAAACISSTTNGTFSVPSGLNVTAPCQLLPDSSRSLQSLTDQVQAMVTASCRSGTCRNTPTNTVSVGGAGAAAGGFIYDACLGAVSITSGVSSTSPAAMQLGNGMGSRTSRGLEVSCFAALSILFALT